MITRCRTNVCPQRFRTRPLHSRESFGTEIKIDLFADRQVACKQRPYLKKDLRRKKFVRDRFKGTQDCCRKAEANLFAAGCFATNVCFLSTIISFLLLAEKCYFTRFTNSVLHLILVTYISSFISARKFIDYQAILMDRNVYI